MKFDPELMNRALEEGNGDFVSRSTEISDKDVRYIRQHLPHREFAEYLIEKSFAGDNQFCAQNVYSIPEMIRENTRKDYGAATEHHFIIGSAPDGDSVALSVDQQSQQIGFIAHEGIENMPFIGVSDSISDFFWNSWHVDDYPTDYWEAKTSQESKET